jgi:hypothetical protein
MPNQVSKIEGGTIESLSTEKLTGTQMAKRFPAFNGVWSHITVVTKASTRLF